MPTVGSNPNFHLTPVRIEFDAAIPRGDARTVWGAITWLVRTLTRAEASLTELLDQTPVLTAAYGYEAYLVDISADEIAFRISLRHGDGGVM